MRSITAITLFLLAALLCLPGSADGQQIAPNPNPLGNIITLNFNGWYNNDIFQNNGTLENHIGTLDNNNTLSNNVAGTLTNNSTLYNSSTMYNYGTLTNDTGGMLNNSGSLNILATGTLANHGTLQNYGTLTNDTGGTLINLPGGTLTNYYSLYNHGTLTNDSTLQNYGTLTNDTGGTLINLPGGTLTNHGTLTNNGTIDTTSATFTNNGTYRGSGHISGSWYDHGHIKPGNSAGVMTMDGNYYKRGGSKEIEVGGHFHGGGDNSLTEFDWLDVTGDVELAGVLDVYLINGFELLAGMSFEILNVGGALTGEYDGLDEGHKVGSFSGTNLYITYAGGDGNDVTLYSRAVPEPTTLLLALFGLALLPRRKRR